jgi:hypothetical protein
MTEETGRLLVSNLFNAVGFNPQASYNRPLNLLVCGEAINMTEGKRKCYQDLGNHC